MFVKREIFILSIASIITVSSYSMDIKADDASDASNDFLTSSKLRDSTDEFLAKELPDIIDLPNFAPSSKQSLPRDNYLSVSKPARTKEEILMLRMAKIEEKIEKINSELLNTQKILSHFSRVQQPPTPRKRKFEETQHLANKKFATRVDPDYLFRLIISETASKVEECIAAFSIPINETMELEIADLTKKRGKCAEYRKRKLTLLHMAVFLERLCVVEKLLDLNADPNVPSDDEGITPLMTAAAVGNATIAQALLNAKAEKNIADSDGHTAYHIALNKKNFATAALLAPQEPQS